MNAEYTGKKIAELRKAKDLTQKELAQRLHITDKAVSKWERGANFPDLGLMEDLAKELDSTPAILLGIENASQEEVVTSMTQISNEQAEQAFKDVQTLGWLELFFAILLFIAQYSISLTLQRNGLFFQSKMILNFTRGIMVFLIILGIYTLRKYGAIRRFEFIDSICAEIMFFSIAITLCIMLYTGKGLPDIVAIVLYALVFGILQFLFYRILKPAIAKLLPWLLTMVWVIWGIIGYNSTWTNPRFSDLFINYLLPFLVSFIVWIICFRKDKKREQIHLGRLAAILILCISLLPIFFDDFLIQTYVKLFHEDLEAYAQEMLDADIYTLSENYGIWPVHIRPDENMVEFRTGGSGIAPSSQYKGFYYSPDNTHRPFQGGDERMISTKDPNLATWKGAGDNGGTSIRIIKNWFWFEAHF